MINNKRLNTTIDFTIAGSFFKNINIYTGLTKTIPNYDIYTITGNSTFTLPDKADISRNLFFYSVGGGGAGGDRYNNTATTVVGGGGGAGGIILGNVILGKGSYNIVVGEGGALNLNTFGGDGGSTYIDIPNFPIAGGGGGGGRGDLFTKASTISNAGRAGVNGSSGGGSGSAATVKAGGVSSIISDTNGKIEWSDGEAYQANFFLTRSGANGGASVSVGGGGGAGNSGSSARPGNAVVCSAHMIRQLYDNTTVGIGGASEIGWNQYLENTGDGGRGYCNGSAATAGKKGVFILAVPKSTFTCLDVSAMGLTLPDRSTECMYECWIKTSKTSQQYVFTKTGSFTCGITSTGYGFLQIGSESPVVTSVILNDNIWHHISLIVAGTVRLVIDGVTQISASLTVSSNAGVRLFNDGTLNSNQFKGQVYNIRFWDLTSTTFVNNAYTAAALNDTVIQKNRRLILSKGNTNAITDISSNGVNISRQQSIAYEATPEIPLAVTNDILTNCILCQDLSNNKLKNYAGNLTDTTLFTVVDVSGTDYKILDISYSIYQP